MARLGCRPLGRCRKLTYPSKLEALSDPDLLKRHVPGAWVGRREIAGTLGVLLAANTTGCSDKPGEPGVAGHASGARLNKAAIVAPIFEHGDGKAEGRFVPLSSGYIGFYLPEEGALQLIREELAKHGLDMSEQDVEFGDVIVTGNRLGQRYDWISDDRGWGSFSISGPLVIDLVDSERRVAVEYVASEDFDLMCGDDPGMSSCDLKKVAASVAREVEAQGRGIYFGAFYDPAIFMGGGAFTRGAYTDESGRRYVVSIEQARAEAQELLRHQVKDFVEWLKGQGAI